MNEAFHVRRMTADDAAGVTGIDCACFPTPWTQRDFENEMTKNVCARYLVAERDGALIGYAGAHIILDEGHITRIAVLPECRRQGVGRQLTQALLQYAANLGVNYLTLEVRKSNEPAKAMYQALGFIRVGVRPRYYENGEDGWIMVNDRLPPADPDFTEPETVFEDNSLS